MMCNVSLLCFLFNKELVKKKSTPVSPTHHEIVSQKCQTLDVCVNGTSTAEIKIHIRVSCKERTMSFVDRTKGVEHD